MWIRQDMILWVWGNSILVGAVGETDNSFQAMKKQKIKFSAGKDSKQCDNGVVQRASAQLTLKGGEASKKNWRARRNLDAAKNVLAKDSSTHKELEVSPKHQRQAGRLETQGVVRKMSRQKPWRRSCQLLQQVGDFTYSGNSLRGWSALEKTQFM